MHGRRRALRVRIELGGERGIAEQHAHLRSGVQLPEQRQSEACVTQVDGTELRRGFVSPTYARQIPRVVLARTRRDAS
jgi:hypothetical protein